MKKVVKIKDLTAFQLQDKTLSQVKGGTVNQIIDGSPLQHEL